jgi:hypothetical protein
MTTIPIKTRALPAGFCFTNPETDWPKLAALLYAQIENLTNVVISSTTPGPEDQGKVWYKLDASGRIIRRFNYAQGVWSSRHPKLPGEIILYEGSQASIATFDEGTGGPVTEVSGPMWEEVTQLQGRIPLGPGALPTSGVEVAVGANGGADQLELTLEEENLPSHRHQIGVEAPGGISGAQAGFLAVGAGEEVSYSGGPSLYYGWTRRVGDGEAKTLDTLNPYYGIFFIRRTARLFYTA